MAEYELIESWVEINEPLEQYVSAYSLNDVTYKVIGCCFDVYNELGQGFSEIVYKDALEYEFTKRKIQFRREQKFEIKYKDIILPHYYHADFVVENCVILELKAQQGLIEQNVKQVLNYLAASGCEIGLLINFGESSVKYKRVILTK